MDSNIRTRVRLIGYVPEKMVNGKVVYHSLFTI